MEVNSVELTGAELNVVRPWRGSYHDVALNTLGTVLKAKIRSSHLEATDEFIEKEIAPKREKLGKYLDAIDREVVDSFGIFESKEQLGVRIPFTKISVNRVAQNAENKSDAKEAAGKITYVTFRPFTFPPGGGPEDNMNSDYDRVIMSLPYIKGGKNVEVYGLGLPTSKWGSVSEDWLAKLKKSGFSEYGKLYAEFLGAQVPNLLDASCYFYAGSMGTILASETAKQMPEIWERLKLVLDVPSGVHKPAERSIKLPFVGEVPLSLKGFQVFFGFGAEALIRAVADDLVRMAIVKATPAREALDRVLQKKGIFPFESSEQVGLKKQVANEAIRILIKGTPLDTDDFRSYVVQGMLAPDTFSLKRLIFLMTRPKNKRFFQFGNRSLGMGVNYTHWMDRGRWAERWLRQIEQYEK